jgi:predicted GIY-YIG superfamily endonuclease
MMTAFLYVIGPLKPPIKIGITKNCEKRLMNLQTGHSEKLFIHHREPIDSGLAKTFESIIHENLRLKRTHGEWFNISIDEAINEIKWALIRYENEPGLKHRYKNRLLTG